MPTSEPLASSPSASRANATRAMPAIAQAMPAATRMPTRSLSSNQDSRATTAGSAAMITPAASAVLWRMPNSMQIENRKLPKNDSRKSRRVVAPVERRFGGGRRSHGAIATAAIAKRSHASRNTGKTMTSAFEKPT